MRALLIALAFVGGCGGTGTDGAADMEPSPDLTPPHYFAGNWSGTVTQTTTTCSDGSTAPGSSTTFNLPLTQTATQVQWKAACGAEIVADVLLDGTDAAESGSIACPTTTNASGQQITNAISALKMSVAGLGIALNLSFHSTTTVVSGTATVTCNSDASGTLQFAH